MVLYVTKGYQLLSSVENPWLGCLVLQQCGRVQVPSHRQMVIEVLLDMVEKTKEICVIPTFTSYNICTCSFDLLMFCVNFDTFAIIVSFINISQEPSYDTIGIFEIYNIIGVTMTN